MTPEASSVLSLMRDHTYDEVSGMTGWSRGRIYNLLVREGARKTESRIRERAAERKARQEEYLREILNTTAKADVLDFLDGIPGGSVDLVVTSPPYNLGKRYGDGASADAMRFTYYTGWMTMVAAELARVLVDGGTVFLQIGATKDDRGGLYPLDVLLFDVLKNSGLTFRSRVVWTVPHGLTPKGRLAERYETALVFSKGTPVFNPTAARVPQKEPHKRAFKGPRTGNLSGHPLGAHPTNVWSDIGNVGHNHPDGKWGRHPAQFPVKLAKRAILLYTMPGGLVCDPFSGSGTVHQAAVESGRNFVGADIFYEELRESRLKDARADRLTALPGVTDGSVAVWQAEAVKKEGAGLKITAEREEQMCLEAFLPETRGIKEGAA